MENIEFFKECASKIGITINDDHIKLFFNYLNLLLIWNSKINLTSIEDEKEIVLKHFIDSLIPTMFINFSNKKVVDIGTGAGIPGIPIKIFYGDELELTLVDSSKKKIKAVESICKELNLKNVVFTNINVELLGRDEKFRGRYDYALIRAVGSISTIIEYSIPLLKNNGKAILYKGPNVDKEVENSVKSQHELKAEIVKKLDFLIPLSDYKRNIIVVEKVGETDEKYPRKVGIPKNRPL